MGLLVYLPVFRFRYPPVITDELELEIGEEVSRTGLFKPVRDLVVHNFIPETYKPAYLYWIGSVVMLMVGEWTEVGQFSDQFPILEWLAIPFMLVALLGIAGFIPAFFWLFLYVPTLLGGARDYWEWLKECRDKYRSRVGQTFSLPPE
jgi:hypothetical protein